MAGNMLHDREHAAIHQARRVGPRQGHDVFNVQAVGAVADHIMGTGLRYIQHRQAIGGNSNFNQVLRHEAAHVARGAQVPRGDSLHRDRRRRGPADISASSWRAAPGVEPGRLPDR